MVGPSVDDLLVVGQMAADPLVDGLLMVDQMAADSLVDDLLMVDQMAAGPLVDGLLVVDRIEHNTNHIPPFYITYYMHIPIKGEIYHTIALCPFLTNMCLSHANPPTFPQRI